MALKFDTLFNALHKFKKQPTQSCHFLPLYRSSHPKVLLENSGCWNVSKNVEKFCGQVYFWQGCNPEFRNCMKMNNSLDIISGLRLYL